ncbi:hypothetical protein BBJ28_00011391 [Nothophytophthora sp. Chile5]|nr:hypothetical protein BBJ28_00011391 [Nothophytophthora sp. Chile5]
MKMPQFMPPPVFSESELLDVLTGMDDTDRAMENESGETTGEERSPLGPSVNVVLDGDVFASEKEFAEFMDSLAPEDEACVAATSDDTMSETTSSSSPPPEGEEAAPKGKRKAVSASTPCKPTRKRRKHELDHLRAVAAELEKKLKKLSEPPSTDQPGANHFWKRVSNQLLSQRQKSVGENARLRELVREQVKAVKSLQRTLAKTPDLSLYRDLFRNISSSYNAGISAMPQQAGAPNPSVAGDRKINMEMRTDGDCGPRMCLQVVESRRIPFNLMNVGEHAWKFLSGANGHDDFKMAFQNQGNEMFGQCTLNSSSGPVELLGNVAVRRYIEADKLTFMWECDGHCPVELDSLACIRQTGWCVFEPAEDDPENETIFRTCCRMTPTFADASASFADSSKSIGTTTDLVIQSYEKTVVYIFDAVLDSLVQVKT